MGTFQIAIIAYIKTKKKASNLVTRFILMFWDTPGNFVYKTYIYISFSSFHPRIKKGYTSVTPALQQPSFLQTYP